MAAKLVDIATAKEWLAAGEAHLVDVRGPDQYGREHIPAARSVPFDLLEEMLPQAVPSRAKVIFQCNRGGRAGRACSLADASPVLEGEFYNLEGGIEGWKAAGLKVIRSAD